MQKIVPYLWYDKGAAQAAELYVSNIPGSKIISNSALDGTPSGSVEIVPIELAGLEVTLMAAGPYFTHNPTFSFILACDSPGEVDRLYKALSCGTDLMPLGEYPFSARYAWIADRFGLSWQLIYQEGLERPFTVTPTLMFVGEAAGKAQEAVNLYTRLLPESTVDNVLHYGPDETPDIEGSIKHASLRLFDVPLAVMDSAYEHAFAFNEAASLMVRCDNQEEIDRYWLALSAKPEAEQCGWLKDRFGVSWQIVPTALDEMMSSGKPEAVARVTNSFMAMKKLDIAQLVKAYLGE